MDNNNFDNRQGFSNQNWFNEKKNLIKENFKEYRKKLKRLRVEETLYSDSIESNQFQIESCDPILSLDDILPDEPNEEEPISLEIPDPISIVDSEKLIIENDIDSTLLKLIFDGFGINVKQFCLSFVICCQRLKLSLAGRDILLDFLKSLFPFPNNLPSSYNQIIKTINFKPVNEISLCEFCQQKLINDKCSNENCYSINQKVQINKKNSIFVFDTEKQIINIVQSEWSHFKSYKENLKKETINDVCNSNIYSQIENPISLILFADAANITKSSNTSMWAIFSTIVELPPIIRNAKKNIIIHTLWNGELDFNLIFKYYTKIDNLINKGTNIIVDGTLTHFNVRILGLISDTVARPKLCNSTQFNGGFGCLHCLHPNSNCDGKYQRSVYFYDKNIKSRTNDDYNLDVRNAEKTKKRSNGIKGFTYLSNWISIPDCVLLDYMHLSLEGMTNWFLDHWLSDTNTPYYLGRVLLLLDKRAMKAKYPIEFSRRQRSFNERNRFKANELRNLAFYLIPAVMFDFLPAEYYNNVLCYLVFLRILTKEAITLEDLDDAKNLIIFFYKSFEKLYGVEAVTFNLHGHIHLVDQVKKFGPINKISTFPFEGMFKHSKEYLSGTRGLVNQIAQGLQLEKYLSYECFDVIDTINSPILRDFVLNSIQNKNKDIESFNFMAKDGLNSLSAQEKLFLEKSCLLNNSSKIEVLKRAFVKNQSTRKKCEDDALQFELEISVVSDDDERQISDLNIQLPQSSHCLRVSSQTNISPVPTSSNDFLNKSNQNNYENGDQISQISDQIKNLNEKIENLNRIGRIPSVMFNGFNLVSLSAKDSTKYALRVAAHIFSKDELSNNGILDHCRISTRNQLDPVRVDLIKESVMVKYGISIDKLETTVNQKCD
ncbi:unnamed protein product [Brachionus calyciflorus]|uniref:BEN domain-containing protein n=1 Tax=Brachionus calyciflorus TaxID=104777 RepID=A0A813SYA4_9BILA|nr:unnamed protein product [Brachionus calyciflorus]